MLIAYLWINKVPLHSIKQIVKHHALTVGNFVKRFQKAVNESLGEQDFLVEIDETKPRKNNDWWIIGGTKRTQSKKIFFVATENHDKETIREIIKTHVQKGSIIITDSWKRYSCISKLGFRHYRINHLKQLKGAHGYHTNTIEGRWRALKKKENWPEVVQNFNFEKDWINSQNEEDKSTKPNEPFQDKPIEPNQLNEPEIPNEPKLPNEQLDEPKPPDEVEPDYYQKFNEFIDKINKVIDRKYLLENEPIQQRIKEANLSKQFIEILKIKINTKAITLFKKEQYEHIKNSIENIKYNDQKKLNLEEYINQWIINSIVSDNDKLNLQILCRRKSIYFKYLEEIDKTPNIEYWKQFKKKYKMILTYHKNKLITYLI
ncbi:4042_t:CDS:2 [Gigaspora margarita]|uniref:4042_t:CDS:1 n=1 Tax=Gigaspora margarita TaxID=4874 RepID=A0ABN7UC39_GIGMA|nr:4042_t:CDS:2 [Gigaspora margarita]